MSIAGNITDDLKAALKSGDRDRVSVLRMVKSSMKNREIDKKGPLTDEDVEAILMLFAKRAKESIEQFSKAGRTELSEKEERELSIVRGYLPEQLPEDEMRQIIRAVIDEQDESGPAAMGKIMKASMARLKGRADGRLVNKIVKEMLEA